MVYFDVIIARIIYNSYRADILLLYLHFSLSLKFRVTIKYDS